MHRHFPRSKLSALHFVKISTSNSKESVAQKKWVSCVLGDKLLGIRVYIFSRVLRSIAVHHFFSGVSSIWELKTSLKKWLGEKLNCHRIKKSHMTEVHDENHATFFAFSDDFELRSSVVQKTFTFIVRIHSTPK